MTGEKASSWSESEHRQEKKEVLGRVEQKLESRIDQTAEIAEIVSNIGKFRYPVDPDFHQRECKRSAFDKAVDDAAGYCGKDQELCKYGIAKKDILDWCKIPMMEKGYEDSFSKMEKNGPFELTRREETPNAALDKMYALKTGLGMVGISGELLPFCRMTVTKRNPESFTDRLYGLPKPPEGTDSHIIFLEFQFKSSRIKLFYDSSSPRAVKVDAIRSSSGSPPVIINGTATLKPDLKLDRFDSQGGTFPANSLDSFLKLFRLAEKDETKS